MSEEKRKEETALMTTWLAGVMGWTLQEARGHIGSGYMDAWWIDKESKLIVTKRDYRPTEILGQALTALDKWNSANDVNEVAFMNDTENPGNYEIGVIVGNAYVYQSYPLSEIAYQIVKTLYEERKEK